MAQKSTSLCSPVNLLLIFFLIFSMTSCNKDDVIEDINGKKPVISLDSEDGIYTVKIGHELTISPDVENADNAIYTWLSNGKIIGRAPSLTVSFDETQEVYVTFRVETLVGTAQEELKIEVLEKTPPVISLVLPSQGLKVLPNTEYVFTPEIQHSDEPDFEIEWIRDGRIVSTEMTYTFSESELGTYPIIIKARNDDGETEKKFSVEVVKELPYKVSFPSPSYFQPVTDRNTIVGRPLYLTPILEYVENPSFEWSVNGNKVSETGRTYIFTSDKPGEFIVSVSVNSNSIEGTRKLTRNISRGETELIASVIVHCYEKEDTYRRDGGNTIYSNTVYEFLPAPGQFVNELGTAGYTADITTEDKAREYAASRLRGKQYVSLGGWGGYVIVGFDHSIRNSGGNYDFAIQGNAFNSVDGGSNEPGIVWVMQDTNGNGKPDDEWYELRGSETGNKETIQSFWMTYFRPAGPKMDVHWVDSQGNTGKIKYLGQFHSQSYYYPLWIKADSYTLYGTRLPANNTVNPETGYWANNAFAWGYADNMGKDCLGGDAVTGSGQMNGFKISNAMHPDGSPVSLGHIDFIKVQTGVNAQSGSLGENSCEVFSFQDLNK